MALLLALLAPAMWDMYWRVPGRLDLWVHHRDYEQVVRQVQSLVSRGQQVRFRRFGRIQATAHRNADGSTTILLMMANWGHFGWGGYTYGEPSPPSWQEWESEQAVAPGWRAVYGSD